VTSHLCFPSSPTTGKKEKKKGFSKCPPFAEEKFCAVTKLYLIIL
jgi:hypothetical protein